MAVELLVNGYEADLTADILAATSAPFDIDVSTLNDAWGVATPTVGQFRALVGKPGAYELMVLSREGAAAGKLRVLVRAVEGTAALTHSAADAAVKVVSLATAKGLLLVAEQEWQDLGNLGATETITAAPRASKIKGTLDQNATITVSLAAGEQIELQLAQDGTGGRSAAFSGVNVWMTQAGTAPDLTGRAALAVDRLAFENVGGVVYGYWLTETVTAASGLPSDELVVPLLWGRSFRVDGMVVAVANRLLLVRAEIRKSGFLRDVMFYNGTASGNARLAVYDTGDASPGNRTKLGDSGSMAINTGGNQWRIWDPGATAIAVTKGQHIELGLIIDNATATYGRGNANGGDPTILLPSGYLVVPGGAPARMVSFIAPGSFTAPTPITEASLGAGGGNPVIVARVA